MITKKLINYLKKN
jgi:hypothetical protein